jgi:hypothetical protein
MNFFLNLHPQQFKFIYNSLINYKGKEKIDMVLEPLQSIIQVALLSITPIGTKLSIYENILYLQTPSITQPVSRWYNSDKKDDLYFLFQVIKRFNKWYNPNNNKKSLISIDLYNLIIKMTIKGLENLLKTYNTIASIDNNSIIQLLYMYIDLLNTQNIDEKPIDNIVKFDKVFENIVEIYNIELLNIIYNFLLIVEKEENKESIDIYINGLNMIMTKNNKKIKEWIKVNFIL